MKLLSNQSVNEERGVVVIRNINKCPCRNGGTHHNHRHHHVVRRWKLDQSIRVQLFDSETRPWGDTSSPGLGILSIHCHIYREKGDALKLLLLDKQDRRTGVEFNWNCFWNLLRGWIYLRIATIFKSVVTLLHCCKTLLKVSHFFCTF